MDQTKTQNTLYSVISYNKTIEAEIIVGRKCNFRCPYCFTRQDPKVFKDEDDNVLIENIDKVFEHLDYLLNIAKSHNLKSFSITFFGGEPFCYPSLIKKIVDRYHSEPLVRFCFITNGSLLLQNFSLFDNVPKERLFFSISYDYCLQDETRHAGTYQIVRDAIKFLKENNISLKTITVLTSKTIYRIVDVLSDYVKLVNEIGEPIRATINTAKNSYKDFTQWDDEKLMKKFEIVKNFSKKYPKYRLICNVRGLDRKSGAYFDKIQRYAINPNGQIGWDCVSFFRGDLNDPYIFYGSIFQSPEEVVKKRVKILTEWGGKISEECQKCPALACKLDPYSFLDDTSPKNWGSKPNASGAYHCKVTQWITNRLFSEDLKYCPQCKMKKEIKIFPE